MTEERLAELMVKAADGLATPEEHDALMRLAATDPALAEELRAHVAVKAVTDGWVARLANDVVEDRWSQSPITRVERGLGLALLVGGIGLLSGFGLWELFLDPTAPWWVKGGTAMLGSGTLVLLVSVLRWKWSTSNDPYSEVQR